jgi:hypothetical protein
VTSRALIALAAAYAGCLPPDAPPRAPSDPDITALVHAWRVDAHLLGKHTSLSDADAAQLHGRAVSIRDTGYATPWHGTCEESGQTQRERLLAEVAAELAIDRPAVLRLGFTNPLVEHRLSCLDPGHRAPTLTVYTSAGRALTCFAGVCYVLAR